MILQRSPRVEGVRLHHDCYVLVVRGKFQAYKSGRAEKDSRCACFRVPASAMFSETFGRSEQDVEVLYSVV